MMMTQRAVVTTDDTSMVSTLNFTHINAQEQHRIRYVYYIIILSFLREIHVRVCRKIKSSYFGYSVGQ